MPLNRGQHSGGLELATVQSSQESPCGSERNCGRGALTEAIDVDWAVDVTEHCIDHNLRSSTRDPRYDSRRPRTHGRRRLMAVTDGGRSSAPDGSIIHPFTHESMILQWYPSSVRVVFPNAVSVPREGNWTGSWNTCTLQRTHTRASAGTRLHGAPFSTTYSVHRAICRAESR